jgi:hypothetical protein
LEVQVKKLNHIKSGELRKKNNYTIKYRKGVNCFYIKNEMKLAGGEWLVVVKFHESKLSMMIKEGNTSNYVVDCSREVLRCC